MVELRKEQVSKFTCRNNVTSSRTLLKSHKGLEGSERFARSCFRKKLIWKISTKVLPKETVMKFFLQLPQKPVISRKKNQDSYFPITFEKVFQNTVLCQNTGKGTERTEAFDFRSENFRKSIRKKLYPFLVTWQPSFIEKELYCSYFPVS